MPTSTACSPAQTDSITTYNPAAAEFSASQLTGIDPLAVTFTDASTGDVTSRSWDFGDGGTSTAQNPAHTYNAPGTYNWTVAVSVDGETCTQTGTVAVEEPCTLTCPGTADPTSGDAPLTVQFSSDPVADNCDGSLTYDWNFGDGMSSAE